MGKLQEFISKIIASKRFNLIAFSVITAMVLISYANTFKASFHFDDHPSIVDNSTIRHISGENVLSILKGSRPVVYLSIMLNYQLSGVNVVGWHIFNIGTHVINSIFVYLLISWTLTLPSFGKAYAEKSKWMALFGALLFGVHPIQTESVTYIISRSELLATCFYLATFLLFIKGIPTTRFAYVIGMLVTSTLSMSSKEWAVTLPALLLLYDYLFIAEGKITQVLSRWYVYVLTALPWILVLRNLDLTSKGGAAGVGFNLVSNTGITPWSYMLTSLNVIWTYVLLLFLPINQNLDYNYPVAKTLFELPTILSFAGHLIVVIASFWLYQKKRWRLIPFGLAWFYIGLSPVQSIVPVVDVIFEHRAYMPSVGFFLAFIVAFDMAFERLEAWRAKRPAEEKAA